MNATPSTLSRAGRARLLTGERRPLFFADWERVVFLHFSLPPEALAPWVPFPLELWEGRAFVSLVGFTMKRLRLAAAPRWSEKLLRPLSEHAFLNVRTYVRHGGESGIYFFAEWLNNRAAVPLGPPLFGLPYRRGVLRFWHDGEGGGVSGKVTAANGDELRYAATLRTAEFSQSARDSREEFLLERYTAFTHWRGLKRLFRIWHEPWPRAPLAVDMLHLPPWPWTQWAQPAGADFSPRVRDVWMGRPHFAPATSYAKQRSPVAIGAS